jgi:hypothetical protein
MKQSTTNVEHCNYCVVSAGLIPWNNGNVEQGDDKSRQNVAEQDAEHRMAYFHLIVNLDEQF